MSDDHRNELREGHELRERLDRELAHLHVTEHARRRFRAAAAPGRSPAAGMTGRRRTRRPGSGAANGYRDASRRTRWPVVAAAAAVVAMIAVPGLATRWLRPAPGPQSTVTGVPGGPAGPSGAAGPAGPASVPPSRSSSTQAPARSASPSQVASATPMPASSLVVGRLVLTVTPSVASTGQPVSTTVTVVVDQPLTAADKARADKAAVDQARAVKSMGTPAQNVGPLHVDWGDGTGDTQRAACPSLLASDVPKVVFRHSYRRPGKYPVTVPAATTGCWSTTQTLAATVAVR